MRHWHLALSPRQTVLLSIDSIPMLRGSAFDARVELYALLSRIRLQNGKPELDAFVVAFYKHSRCCINEA